MSEVLEPMVHLLALRCTPVTAFDGFARRAA